MAKIKIAAVAGALILGATLLPTAGVASSDTGSGGTTGPFICPVFNADSQAGMKNPNAVPIADGDNSIIGPTVKVATTATNDDGAGAPDGAHASPGDSTYTAIWKTGG